MKAAEWECLPKPTQEFRTRTVEPLISYLLNHRDEVVIFHEPETLGAINDCVRRLKKLLPEYPPEWRPLIGR